MLKIHQAMPGTPASDVFFKHLFRLFADVQLLNTSYKGPFTQAISSGDFAQRRDFNHLKRPAVAISQIGKFSIEIASLRV